jgi:hypothetical protein
VRLKPLRGGRKALVALAAVVSLGSVAALAGPASADPTIGPTPAPTANTSVNFSTPTDGLVNGQAVTYTVQTTSPTTLNKVEGHICATGYTTYSSGTFGYSGTTGVRCVNSPGITGGGLTGIQSLYKQGPNTFAAVTNSGPLSFAVGTGTVTWNNAGGQPGNGSPASGNLPTVATPPAVPLVCDVTHKCDLVLDVGLTGDSVTDTFFIKPLTFAGAPSAPVISTVSAGNTQATVNWSLLGSGVPSGNGTIDKYVVTATPQNPGVGTCPSPGVVSQNVTTGFALPSTPVSANSATLTGLANFCAYNFTMTAENVATDGTTHFTSPASAAVAGTPSQPGPTLSGAPGDSQVTLNWGAVAGAANYRVTVSPLPTSGVCSSGTCLTGNVTTFTVPGLVNTTPYAFTVAAQIGTGGPFTSESNTVSLTPNGALIHQTIDVVRPTGTLVISQYCSGSPTDILGNFDPSNNNGNNVPNAVPNTNCNLTLSGPRTDQLKTDAITAEPRSVTDAITNGTTTVQSNTVVFTANDLNQQVRGDGIPAGTRIVSVTDASHAVLSNAATITFDGGQFAIVGNTVNFGTVNAGYPATIAFDNASTHVVGNEIEGLQIPGGSTITAVASNATIDISQPADNASNGFTTREWLQSPTPAHVITSGPHAGQYLQATGQLRQVMIVDTRPADTGWTATGVMGTFSDGSGHSFSGDDLGWSPKTVHAFSQPIVSPDGNYTMAPAKGGLVLPATIGGLGTGTTTSNDTLVTGSVPGQTLAYAPSGQGLGLAQLDADLTLYIPVFKTAGHYTGVLTLTAV